MIHPLTPTFTQMTHESDWLMSACIAQSTHWYWSRNVQACLENNKERKTWQTFSPFNSMLLLEKSKSLLSVSILFGCIIQYLQEYFGVTGVLSSYLALQVSQWETGAQCWGGNLPQTCSSPPPKEGEKKNSRFCFRLTHLGLGSWFLAVAPTYLT